MQDSDNPPISCNLDLGDLVLELFSENEQAKKKLLYKVVECNIRSCHQTKDPVKANSQVDLYSIAILMNESCYLPYCPKDKATRKYYRRKLKRMNPHVAKDLWKVMIIDYYRRESPNAKREKHDIKTALACLKEKIRYTQAGFYYKTYYQHDIVESVFEKAHNYKNLKKSEKASLRLIVSRNEPAQRTTSPNHVKHQLIAAQL